MAGLEEELTRLATEGDMQGVQNILNASDEALGLPFATTGSSASSGAAIRSNLTLHVPATMLESTESRFVQLLGRLGEQTSVMPASGRSRTRVERQTTRDDTYDLLTQNIQDPAGPLYPSRGGPYGLRVRYDIGLSNRWPHPNMMPPYRTSREAPLSSADACNCRHFEYEHAPHRLHPEYEMARIYREDDENGIRRRVFAESGFGTTSDRQLVEMRQSRALAGLDVSEYDAEIARRVLADPEAWGALGEVMRQMGWVDEVVSQGEDYVLH